jgi:hypothetical protein
MKQTAAANLAILLLIIGWALAVYGFVSIEAHYLLSFTVLCVGVFGILSALWLSGYSFSVAKIRASVCLVLVFLPLAAYLVTGWLYEVHK